MINDWYSYDLPELEEQMKALGEKAFRAKQLFKQLHNRRAQSFEEMTDLSQSLKQKLNEKMPLDCLQIVQEQTEADGTGKFLLKLSDGSLIESVLMHYHYGYSLCVSSQVGCRMGCRFCASTLGGLQRNLSAGEMLQQLYAVEKAKDISISHIVIMGCGEPFDNFEAVQRFMELLHHQDGKGLSYRNMTVSTCGLPEKIEAFTKWGEPVTLAISLHAPNDTVRRQIMQIAKAVSMKRLQEVCRFYADRTNKRITFEYILLRDVNDSKEAARELALWLKPLLPLCQMNLIMVNPVEECGYERTTTKRRDEFEAVLKQQGIPVTIRRSLGRKIDAACGQLRAKAERISNGRIN